LPLPEDVHDRVQSKIEKSAEKKSPSGRGDATRNEEVLQDIDAEDSQTRLATSLFMNGSAPTENGGNGAAWVPGISGAAESAQKPDETERMKGTGDVLNGRFVLEECIGTGGMSSVYKALDRRKLEANDRNPYVAVKVLNVEFRAHPDSLVALQREAKKSQSLAHPNIVRVYDFDRDGATVYMTMEYLPGQSLAKILRAPGFKGLPESRCMEILEGIAEALRFAHENGIIHADFKPANVILTDDEKIKVIDFGIARAFQRPEDTDMEATRFDPGSLGALTPTYASPEMLEHREPDPRDDIYALACIAYEMFTGRHPFGRMQATEARDGGLEAERRKHLSRRQWKALKSALDFDREKRTPTIAQFIAEMQPKRVINGAPVVPAAVKLALAASAGFLIFYYLVPGVSKNTQVEPNAATDVEIASMQVPRQDAAPVSSGSESGEVIDTANSSTSDNPDKARLLAKVGIDPVAPLVKKLKPTLASIEGVLDEVPCSVFSASLKGGTTDIHGYVSRKINLPQLEQDLLALPGIQAVNTHLKPVDAEKCAVIDLFKPYWEANRKTGASAAVLAKGGNSELTEGDSLVIEITTPGYETYVNVDYFSLDGGVVHMVPSPRARDNQAPANYSATIGDLGEWTIGEPFGSEMVTVLMTPKPLFDEIRAEHESKADYLAALEKRLKRIKNTAGDKQIAVDFVMIDTKPKSILQKIREKAASN